jgi:CubicO group peptidase (beta-lactamase class C family)
MQIQALLPLVPFYILWSSLVPSVVSRPVEDNKQYKILDQETDDFVEKVLKDWKSPGGVAIAFVRRDETGKWVDIETKGYGTATATGTKVTPETMFNIGSNSKVSTSGGVLTYRC